MWRVVTVLAFVGVVLTAESSAIVKKYNVTVGYLPCLTGPNRDRHGFTISGAISMALEEINNSTELLPDVKLLLRWNDTKCDEEIASKLVKNMSDSGVVAFFGPEEKCEKQAIFARSRNLPMISYKCFDYETSPLPNFAMLNPPDSKAMKSVLSLLRHYRWNTFSILYDEVWTTASHALSTYASQHNMTVVHRLSYMDEFKCCEHKMTCCDPAFWYKNIQITKDSTRIYVVLGSTSNLIDIMTAMDVQQLFKSGEYMVIFVDMMAYNPKKSMKYLIKAEDRGSHRNCPVTEEFKKRARSLLVVATSELDSSFDSFSRSVLKYSAQEPFNMRLPSILYTKYTGFVSIYAAYLYDSVKLYATALHSLLQEDAAQTNETLTYQRLMTVATNGSRIVSRMITNTPFRSVSGISIRLDERADSEGNFSILAFKPVNFIDDEINCTYGMIPVGYFRPRTEKFLEYRRLLPIDWVDGVKPEDKPAKNSSQNNVSVVAEGVAVTIFRVLLQLILLLKEQN